MKKRFALLLLVWAVIFYLFSSLPVHAGNLYRVYFSSKGTGPTSDEIEALNDAGAREQIKAHYPGAYSLVVVQLPKK